MATRRSVDLPPVSNQSRTTFTQELPNVEDQVREYRNGQRRRYNAQRQLQRIGRVITGGSPRAHTLEQAMNPDVQLQLSMRQRAHTVPAEVLYRSIPDTIHHLVYNHRSEERMLVVRDDQADRLFIQRESYEQLQRTGMQFIHLGVLQVRLQILHRQQTGATALVLFRDTRFTDDRSVIAAMEADLSEGNQLIYVIPGIMMTIGDFYRHV